MLTYLVFFFDSIFTCIEWLFISPIRISNDVVIPLGYLWLYLGLFMLVPRIVKTLLSRKDTD